MGDNRISTRNARQPKMEPIVPHLAQRRKFFPQEGGNLTVQIKGERVACEVMKVISEDSVVVQITSIVLAKANQHKTGDLIAARRVVDPHLGNEHWAEVTESDMSMAQAEKLARGAAGKGA